MKDQTVYFQSGAGIVHDSAPIKEYEETVNKAKAIMAAIDIAEKIGPKNYLIILPYDHLVLSPDQKHICHSQM